jgi:hypothetical protein
VFDRIRQAGLLRWRDRHGTSNGTSEAHMEAIIGIVFMLVVWGIVLAGSIYFNNNVQ